MPVSAHSPIRDGLRWRLIAYVEWRATADEGGHYCFAVAL
jgi:hypothetical protein